jgi:hypothetical protein
VPFALFVVALIVSRRGDLFHPAPDFAPFNFDPHGGKAAESLFRST